MFEFRSLLFIFRFIVEQQFTKAVVIVLKTRAYVNTISQELNLAMANTNKVANNKNYRNAAAATAAAEAQAAITQAQTEALIVVLNRVDELVSHLSFAIKKSVLNLPNSQVLYSISMCCYRVSLLVY